VSEPQKASAADFADDPKLAADLASLKRTVEEREARDVAAGITPPVLAPKPKPSAKVYQLPLWPEPVRGAPNSFLRSALFAAIQGKTRTRLKKQMLGSLQGVTVRYTGEQLDQSDLDVWEQAVHLARRHPLGNVCHVTAYAFLQALGRSTGKSNYQWLEDVITRLVACEVILQTKDKTYGGNLIASWKRDEATRSYKLTLNPDLVKLYGWNDWTALDWQQRQSLRGKPLALWLHGFYSSHAQPFPMKIETLRQLSGGGTKRARKFKENLITALADLEAATSIKGTIKGDLVTVERRGSRAQLRHLRRKSPQQDAAQPGRRRSRKTQQKLAINWKRLGSLI
jgi:TrfA protein